MCLELEISKEMVTYASCDYYIIVWVSWLVSNYVLPSSATVRLTKIEQKRK